MNRPQPAAAIQKVAPQNNRTSNPWRSGDIRDLDLEGCEADKGAELERLAAALAIALHDFWLRKQGVEGNDASASRQSLDLTVTEEP